MSSTSSTGTVKATLKSALSNNSRAVADAQNGYDQSVLNVCNGMSSIIASELPVLNSLPANWDEIITAYINAKSDAISWTNQVYARLVSTPDDVASFNTGFSNLFTEALDDATSLVNDPGDATAKDFLKTELNRIQSKLSSVNSNVVETLGFITDFGVTKLPDARSRATEHSSG